MSTSRLVAVIPAGNTIEATVTVMNALAAVYPGQALQMTSDPDTGAMLVLTPTPAQQAAADATPAQVATEVKKAAKKTAKRALAAEPGPVDTTIEMGTGEPGSETAVAVAFRSNSTGVPVIADWAAALLDEYDAQNYLTFTFLNPDGDKYALTVQRCNGLSPAERLAELEAQIGAATP